MSKNTRLRQLRNARRKRRLIVVLLTTCLAGLLALAYWWTYGRRFILTNDAYVTGNLVPLKAQTSGTVAEVCVDNTQYVRTGDTLVRLDGIDTGVRLEQAKANLAEAVRHVETLFSAADTLRQQLAAREAELNRVRHDLDRYRSVAQDGAVSAQQIENTEFRLHELEAGVRQTQAELSGAEALVHGTTPADNPKVLQAANALKQAYLDQVRQDIVAPVSGFVAKRGIQPGEQVRPETPLLAIVPLDYLWVDANFLESELTSVQPGQPVDVTVDLYGSAVVFHGEVLGLGGGYRQRVQPAAARQRDRQLYPHRRAHPGPHRAEARRVAGPSAASGLVGARPRRHPPAGAFGAGALDGDAGGCVPHGHLRSSARRCRGSDPPDHSGQPQAGTRQVGVPLSARGARNRPVGSNRFPKCGGQELGDEAGGISWPLGFDDPALGRTEQAVADRGAETRTVRFARQNHVDFAPVQFAQMRKQRAGHRRQVGRRAESNDLGRQAGIKIELLVGNQYAGLATARSHLGDEVRGEPLRNAGLTPDKDQRRPRRIMLQQRAR